MTTLELDARDMTTRTSRMIPQHFTVDNVTETAIENWGLGSISSRKRGATDYIYDSSAGTGQYNYIVDTGVRASHQEFGGRASIAYNAVNTKDQDTAGHGT
jgi:oryzin